MKFYNLDNLKHSRIFFDKKPPPYLMIFIYFFVIFIIGALLLTIKVNKNYIVIGQGTVTPNDSAYTSSLADGYIVELLYNEGDYIKSGEVLMILSTGIDGEQSRLLNEQISYFANKEKTFDDYEKSLNLNSNYLTNNSEEIKYYEKVEFYLSTQNDDKENNENTEEEKDELVEIIENLSNNIDDYNRQITRLDKLITPLETSLDTIKNNLSQMEKDKLLSNSSDIEKISMLESEGYELNNELIKSLLH